MTQWKKVSPDLAERFERCLPGSPSVERRRMFGCPCAFVNGNMFAGVHETRLIVRVPEEAATHPFVVRGRAMREYAAIDDALERSPAELKKWTERAFEYASALPAKKPKKKRPR